jgi:hypothetical protein
MSATSLRAQRGLLAGLLTLIAFAAGAVAMTAHNPAASSAPQVQIRGHDGDGDGDGDGRHAVAFGERER